MPRAKVTRIHRAARPDWTEALEPFLVVKKAQGRNSCALSDYRRHVSQFFRRHPLCRQRG
ncbi:MAG: hypothetical protein AB1327_02570 [Bacillota bacterium]|uniref:hypothetical protein n=1 Tax=Desulforudis sp. DRI-14 TaxID=3459793 RepID=UPI00346E3AFB